MFSQLKRVHHKILLAMFLALVALGPVQTCIFAFQSASTSAPTPDEMKKLRVAAAQHDLILMLIEDKSFDQVETEWKKVLELKLGVRFEGQIADSLLAIAYKLYEEKQLALAQQILDASLSTVPFSNQNKSDILKLKATIYKDSGDLDDAVRTMRYAIELQNK